MFKRLISFSINNMISEKKLKQTLAKKLSGKKDPIKVAPKSENVDSAINNINQDETTKKFKTTKLQLVQKEIIKNTTNETKAKQTTRKIKKETVDSTSFSLEVSNVKSQNLRTTTSKKKIHIKEEPSTSSSSLEVSNVKSQKVTTTTSKKKISIEEEPCSSKKIKEQLSLKKWEPDNWELILENIRSMRSKDKAPVDTMGCHKCADENANEKTQRYHKLVALMLSSQTKDETTYHAMLRLREHTLTPEVICEMKVNVLENILHPVSFYKNKAKYLQQTSKILVEKYNSDIPDNIKELVALPGVGPKMAHICMSTAWQEVTGIGVDVHVHRISNRLGWLPKPTKEPKQTRVALEAWLPQHLWSDVNHLLVGFGQTVCTPVKPKCLECLNCQICPSAPKTLKIEKNFQNTKVLDLCDKNKFKKTKMHL